MTELLTKETFLKKVFNFEENKEWKFEGDKPCIIDFYADWCGPCKMVAPILEELSEEYKGKIDIYKVDTEAETGVVCSVWYQKYPIHVVLPWSRTASNGSGSASKTQFRGDY